MRARLRAHERERGYLAEGILPHPRWKGERLDREDGEVGVHWCEGIDQRDEGVLRVLRPPLVLVRCAVQICTFDLETR